MSNYNEYNTYSAKTSGDYIQKANPQLGLTANNQTSGIYTNTVLSIGDKYQIDLYGSMMTHKVEDFPLLSILYNMATETAAPPYIVWNDEYKGSSWIDIGLDEMRLYDTAQASGTTTTLPGSGYGATIDSGFLPVEVTDSAYVGGMYNFGAVTAAATTALADVSYATLNVSEKLAITIPTVGAVNCFSIAMKDTANRGRVINIWNRLRNFLYNFQYVSVAEHGGETLYFKNKTTLAPIYFAFDDVFFAKSADLTTAQFYEVIMRIEAATWTGTDLILYLNPAQSNEELQSYTHMLTYINRAFDINAGTAGGLVFDDCISHPSRMIMVGKNVTAPMGVPEGDVFKKTGNFSFHRERYDNYSQIFITPAYGITGTTQASKFRFGNDFASTREMWLDNYKAQKVGAYLTGVKSETVVTDAANNNGSSIGQPVRTLGGLMDFGLFPITYIKKVLPNLTSLDGTGNPALLFGNWLNELGGSLTAFRSAGSKNLTLLCSQKFLDRLDRYVRATFNDPWMGGKIQLSKPSQLTFGLEIYTFKTSKGIQINFVHEPALDYMVQLHVAYHQFGTGFVNPKDILLSIDTANIRQVICRPDVIIGNLQDIGQDAFLEGMRGESSFKLRKPKNHAIIYVPEA